MSTHIHRFIDLVKATESRGQRDVYMTLRDARNLQDDVTRLLLTLEQLRSAVPAPQDPIEIEITGGGFRDSQ
jgi:hypothetical protein